MSRSPSLPSVIISATALVTFSTGYIVATSSTPRWRNGDYPELLRYAGILLGMSIVASLYQLSQTRTHGRRSGATCSTSCATRIFTKLQDLPVAFFTPEPGGRSDLARQQRHRQAQPVLRPGADAVLRQHLSHHRAPASCCWRSTGGWASRRCSRRWLILIVTQLLSPLGQAHQLQEPADAWARSVGEISESLANFKVIVAFNRLDYFREKFDAGQPEANYRASVKAGIRQQHLHAALHAGRQRRPASWCWRYGVWLIGRGELTVGPADRLSALRHHLLQPAAATGDDLVAAATGDGRRSTACPKCWALKTDIVPVAGGAHRRRRARCWPSTHVSFSYPTARRC